MSPVDGIGPPQRNAARSPRKKTTKIPVRIKPREDKPLLLATEPKKPAPMLPSGDADLARRKRLMWLLVIVTALVIFLAWLFIFPSPNTNAGKNGFWNGIALKLTDAWKTIKTDVLHLKATNNNTNVNSEERINQLENDVFPQFTNPTKQ